MHTADVHRNYKTPLVHKQLQNMYSLLFKELNYIKKYFTVLSHFCQLQQDSQSYSLIKTLTNLMVIL